MYFVIITFLVHNRNAKRFVFFFIFRNTLYFCSKFFSKFFNYQMKIIVTTIMNYNWNISLCAVSKITYRMCCTSIYSCVMIMISNFSVICTFYTYMIFIVKCRFTYMTSFSIFIWSFLFQSLFLHRFFFCIK